MLSFVFLKKNPVFLFSFFFLHRVEGGFLSMSYRVQVLFFCSFFLVFFFCSFFNKFLLKNLTLMKFVTIHFFFYQTTNICDVAAPDAQPDPPPTHSSGLTFYTLSLVPCTCTCTHTNMHSWVGIRRRHSKALQRLFVLHESLIRLNC